MPPALPNSPPGWKPTCPKALPSSPCRQPSNSASAPATDWNGSTRNSNAAPASPASSQMKPPSCAWSPPCSTKSATNGKPPKFTSTWITNPSPQFDANEFTERNVARPGVALGWLCTPEDMPSICLLYGFAVALGGLSVQAQSLRLWSMANRTKRHWPIRKLEGIPSISQSALGSELFGADESRERVLKDTESHIDGAS